MLVVLVLIVLSLSLGVWYDMLVLVVFMVLCISTLGVLFPTMWLFVLWGADRVYIVGYVVVCIHVVGYVDVGVINVDVIVANV